jgi:hypothetical protein
MYINKQEKDIKRFKTHNEKRLVLKLSLKT